MSKDSVLQVRLEGQAKEDAEDLFASLGTSLAEAVRIFIAQSLIERGFPFQPKGHDTARGRLHSIRKKDLPIDEVMEMEKHAFQEAMVKKHASR